MLARRVRFGEVRCVPMDSVDQAGIVYSDKDCTKTLVGTDRAKELELALLGSSNPCAELTSASDVVELGERYEGALYFQVEQSGACTRLDEPGSGLESCAYEIGASRKADFAALELSVH